MKKHINIKNFILITAVSLIITGCKYQGVEVGDVQSVKLQKISKEKISVIVDVFVENPNNFKIKLKDYDIKLKLNSMDFDVLELENNLVLPKKFSGNLSIPIHLSKKGLVSFKTIQLIYQIFADKNIKIEASGYITVKVFLIKKTIDFNEKRTINIKGNK